MQLIGLISTAVLSLTLVAAAPAYAQQEEQKAKPAQQEEKKAQEGKPARQEAKPAAQENRNTKQEEKSAQQQNRNTKNEEKNTQQHAQQAQTGKQEQRAGNGGGRIPDDRFKANFGREHTFHVSEGDYRNHRFQYGGYWFAFSDPWPSNWLYTQDVFVIEINGVYYLCNPMYPGVNITLGFTL